MKLKIAVTTIGQVSLQKPAVECRAKIDFNNKILIIRHCSEECIKKIRNFVEKQVGELDRQRRDKTSKIDDHRRKLQKGLPDISD